MLNITNIDSIKGKHFGDREMRVWHVYDVMIGSYYYHFYVENNMDKAWFRLDRNPDRVGSYMLLKGTSNIKLLYTSHIYIKNLEKNSTLLPKVYEGNTISLPIKSCYLRIDKFNSNKLKIPILSQPTITFRDKVFTVLSEELITTTNYDSPVSIDKFNNYYTTNKHIVMIDNNKLIIVNKVSGKLITNMDDLYDELDKIEKTNDIGSLAKRISYLYFQEVKRDKILEIDEEEYVMGMNHGK